ncbi:MAG TPA: ATP-binding protein [Thermoanaerobaculia bacterium]|nr:ATP-binding protein [Thermoanaerobaculia bacterium]
MKELIFISSVQRELATERRAVRDFIRGDALLGQYFDVFLFEDVPAHDGAPEQVYLEEVDRAAIYLGIFGNEYGWEDEEGVSPTEREFDRATKRRRQRLVFVKGGDDKLRQQKMKSLVRKAERQLIRRRFVDVSDLTAKIYASLIRHLEERGVLARRPFHAAACPGATLQDIDPKRLAWFLGRAREERQLALSPKTSTAHALTRLNLLEDGKPTRAAVLLFGGEPQHFIPAGEVKCLHFHGTVVEKPIPSYQVFKGTLFEQVDQAVDFVSSKLGRRVGTRESAAAAPVAYELPRAVLTEAIVNAVAHRDYSSPAAIQVYVFSDRVEVWNPGELPPSLTPESLRQQHPSLPRNPLIAEALFFAHYIEKVGSGTLDVIVGCQRATLPEPEFFQEGDQFVLRLWRDWLTHEVMAALDLNERQAMAMPVLRQERRIATGDYQRLTDASRATAKRDLEDLVEKGLLVLVGAGRGAHYELAKKQLTNGSNGSSSGTPRNGSETAQTARRKRAAGQRERRGRASTKPKNSKERGRKGPKGRSRK